MKSLIGELIDERGLKNVFIAKKMGVSQAQISKWRTGASFPRVDKLFKLAAILNVKVDDLYDMTDDSGNSESEE
ncbi:helix-turn-helix transcriptional regulator [Shouchella miscanthi]|uniref:helix-turn-helix transcriptional regulator n=1 Tax=Shouchella miscanthi TaxID=2598861 RepID=UPI0011A3EA5C|nr:helix-turn-helix transcriptional regulator [Shouchella miscanthi]